MIPEQETLAKKLALKKALLQCSTALKSLDFDFDGEPILPESNILQKTCEPLFFLFFSFFLE